MKKLNTIILTMAVLLMAACSSSSDFEEVVGEDDALYLEASAMFGAEESSARQITRAHWDEGNKFCWDTNTGEMVIVVKQSASGETLNWGERKYSLAKVTSLTGEDAGKASITSTSGMLKTDISKMAVGQTPVYFFSPILPGTGEGTNGSSVSVDGVVTMALPNSFAQRSSHSLADFRKYTYIKAESIISEANNSKIQAAPAHFTGVPAVIRFAVTNNKGASIKVKSIKIAPNAPDGAGFVKELVWTPGNETATQSSEKHSYVEATMGETGETLAAKVKQNYYVFLFPTSFSSATLTLTGTENGSDFSYSCSIPETKAFVSNKIYTWNLTVEDNFLRLGFYDYEDGIIQW